MRCLSCGFDNPEGLKFCGECGTPLPAPCPKCGFANPPRFKFCGDCGTSLVRAAPPQPPSHYTPAYLAEKILTFKSTLEGERKQITVLFADLKGSMELLADRDPEEARALLDPILERMLESVHRYEGTADQVMRDGIMALFGAPIAHEDHAVRACYAALAMQASVQQYAAEVQRSKSVSVHIRVGLNSGEVVVRAIGSDLHMDYTAVRQPTHLAARMEQMALPGSILITPEVVRLTEGYIQVSSLGPVPIKGMTAPVEVFEVTGVGPVRSRLQVAAARGFTRFVGRDAALQTLHQALARAGTGQGQVVAVVGEPGAGKSRLFWEFMQSRGLQSWRLLSSHSVSYSKATANLPVIDLLKTYCQVEDRDDVQRVREQVIGKQLSLDRALQPRLPAILVLLDVPVEDAQWQALDPPQRRRHTLEAVTRLRLRESQVQPLLLVFEDLHWIDSETQALLDSLVESPPTARVLLLANYRPEYRHGWGHKMYYRQLRLDPLSAASVEDLLQALRGQDPSLEPLRQRVIAQTQGNPLFLEESARTLMETGMLVGARGAYRKESLTGDRLYDRFGLPYLPSVLSRAWLLCCLVEIGAFTEGVAIGEEGKQVAEAVDNPFSLVCAYRGIGLLARRRGGLHTAIAVPERGMGVCQARHVLLLFPWVAAALGTAYALSGRARAELSAAIARYRSMEMTFWLLQAEAALAQVEGR